MWTSGRRRAQRVADGELVAGVRGGVQQHDGDRLDARRRRRRSASASSPARRADRRRAGPQRSSTAKRSSGGHERRRVRGAQAVEVGARLAAELDEVGEARGREQRGARGAALEQRVGRHGRAVRERRDVARRERRRRRARARSRAITPTDSSCGRASASSRCAAAPSGEARTASVNVPPTSTPSSIGRTLPAQPLAVQRGDRGRARQRRREQLLRAPRERPGSRAAPGRRRWRSARPRRPCRSGTPRRRSRRRR